MSAEIPADHQITTTQFKDLLYYSAKLVLNGDPNPNFSLLVEIGKKLYLAHDKQNINLNELYNVIIQDGDDSTTIPFRLEYSDEKYQVFFINDNNGDPRACKYTFTYSEDAITSFKVYSNGTFIYMSNSIDGYSCNASMVLWGSTEYDAAELMTELSAAVSTDHQITITQQEIAALEAELNS